MKNEKKNNKQTNTETETFYPIYNIDIKEPEMEKRREKKSKFVLRFF